MKNRSIVFTASLFLAACASSPQQPGSSATMEKIKEEMAQAGNQRKTQNPEIVANALIPPLSIDLPKSSAQVIEPRFNLAINNADVQQVLLAMVVGSRYSMLIKPEVTGKVSVNLKDVTVPEAMEAIRELYGYDYRIQGNRIYVGPNTMQSRLFRINYLANRRIGTSDLRVTTGSTNTAQTPNTNQSGIPGALPTAVPSGNTPNSNNRSTDNSRVSTYSDSDFWKDLGPALSSLVGKEDGRSVVVNPISGVVIVRALPNELRSVEEYLRATQAMIERQVMLEAKIIEVQLNDSYQTGINWAYFGKNADGSRGSVIGVDPGRVTGGIGSQASAPALGDGLFNQLGTMIGNSTSQRAPLGVFGLALQTSNFVALLNFLETQGAIQVLSSPRIATINNQMAVLKVGTDDFFVTNIQSNTTTTVNGGTTSTPNITLQSFFSGISLNVTPQIDDNGIITLHIHPSISNVTEKNKVLDLGTLGSMTLPLASSVINETDSIVRVQDGYIVAIGGLMKQESSNDRSQIPGTSNIPVLNNLLGQKSQISRKKELVILIKPTLIETGNDWHNDLAQTQGRLERLDPQQKAN